MTPPWPARVHVVDWLIWAHQANAVLWLPSAQEQDQEWSRIFGARAAEFAAGRHHVDQMREVFTG